MTIVRRHEETLASTCVYFVHICGVCEETGNLCGDIEHRSSGVAYTENNIMIK